MIIARGAVYVAHGQGNVIVAGHFIHVSHDGNARPVRNVAGPGGAARAPGGGPQWQVVRPGSLLVSGSTMDVSHANGSVCAAGDMLRISHAHGCLFVNPPASMEVSNQDGCRTIVAEKVRVAGKRHPLSDKLRLQMLVPRKGVVFSFDKRRYVADLGMDIVDEAGKPVEALAGWKLSFCDEGFALFTKGKEDFGLALAAEGQGQ